MDYAQEGNCRKINFLLKQLDYIHERLELIFACGNCLLRRYLISKVDGFSYFVSRLYVHTIIIQRYYIVLLIQRIKLICTLILYLITSQRLVIRIVAFVDIQYLGLNLTNKDLSALLSCMSIITYKIMI